MHVVQYDLKRGVLPHIRNKFRRVSEREIEFVNIFLECNIL